MSPGHESVLPLSEGLTGFRPWRWAAILAAFCVLPLMLLAFGVDFSTSGPSLRPEGFPGLSPHEIGDAVHRALRGSFTHTLLEWTAVVCAAFICVLALSQFKLSREPSLPVIGIALACAGAMDAFHTLAADRLIDTVGDNRNLIPFTWAICRLFNGGILLLGVGIFALLPSRSWGRNAHLFVVAISAAFVAVAYAVIYHCATSNSLPQTMFPDSGIKRPYDIYPLIPYLLCGLVVFPIYLKRHRSLFGYALLLSIIPQIATQLYMAFGSLRLHDSAFNIAHALKAVAYITPVLGLLAEIAQTYRERQQAEQALKVANARLESNITDRETMIRAIVETAVDAIITIDERGTIESVNPAAERMFGYTSSEMIGRNVKTLMPQPYMSEHDQYLTNFLKSGTKKIIGIGREVVAERKDGTTFPIDLGVSELRLGDQRFFTGIIRDITERNRAELELRRTEERLHLATTGAGIGTWHWDIVREELTWSERCNALFGIPPGSQMSYERFLEALHPADRERTHQAVTDALDNRTDYAIEYRSLWPDGSVHWIAAMGRGSYDDTGQPLRMEGVVLDINDRRNAEDALQQAHDHLEDRVEERTADLRRSNAELEQFAYVASHDLQEPLRMVASYTQLLERRYKDKLDSDAQEYIAFAVDGTVRMKQLINDLLMYSRVGTHGRDREPTDCDTVVEHALANLKTAIEECGARMTVDPLPTVLADGVQLGQLFQNLIGNAVKYRGSNGTPEIHVGAAEQDGEWLFSIRDNGMGIDPQYAERIFVIFQRLHGKGEYSGTGIGLAVCKKIVERHGGRIWVDSAPEMGSTFYFTLPHGKEIPNDESTPECKTDRHLIGGGQPR